MPEPTLNYVSCADPSGGHRMAYWEWGDALAPHLIVCAHGLSRQGRVADDQVEVVASFLLGQRP